VPIAAASAIEVAVDGEVEIGQSQTPRPGRSCGSSDLRDTARAVSQENVEIVRRGLAAWNRGDYDAWIATCDEDCEFRPLRSQLEGHAYRGHRGLRQFAREITEEWEHVRFVPNEIRDRGDLVVALAHFDAKGRASGVDLDLPVGILVRLRAGKMVEGRVYSDPDEALEAAGLRE
jgi:ketosteroid isomerase-like protein